MLAILIEPGAALSTSAQIAVAIAGFAGVVAVFRNASVHDSKSFLTTDDTDSTDERRH